MSILSGMQYIAEQGEQGYKRGQANKLAKLTSQVYGAQPAQRQAIVQEMMATDPQYGMQMQDRMQKQDDDYSKRLAGAANYIINAHKSGDQAAIQGAYNATKPMWQRFAAQQGIDRQIPDQFDENMMPVLHQIVAASGGQMGAQEDNTPASIRELQMLQSNPELMAIDMQRRQAGWRPEVRDVPRGDGSKQQMVFDPRTGEWSIPSYEGSVDAEPAPQSGAAGQMMGDAYDSAIGNTDLESNRYRDAIAGIESDGSGGYAALGPATRSGDRAYGRYQVMGENIPKWTKEALGQSLTPQEFINNPQAQDAVFDHVFGGYVNKYGPEGAARAWFAGEGGMSNPNARDVLGTTVGGYGNKFSKNLGGRGGNGRLGVTPASASGTESYSQPQEVIGPDGKARLVQFGNRGGMREVSGFAPKPSTKSGGGGSLPAAALKADLEIEDALGATEQSFRIAQKHLERMADGRLVLSPLNAALSRSRTAAGISTDNDRAITDFNADKQSLVNESLRLNKGVQTEGDAQRAAKTLMATNDHKTALASMKRLIELNKQAVVLQKRKRQLIYANYGKDTGNRGTGNFSSLWGD